MSEQEINIYLYDFASINHRVFFENLKNLANDEYWGEHKEDKKYPILENYIIHTFKRLANLYNNSTGPEKDKWVVFENSKAIINTGLYTDKYNQIYLIFDKNKNSGKINPKNKKKYQPYYCIGCFESCSYEVLEFSKLPVRAKYFEKIEDLVYDYNLELVVQISHILDDPRNKSRIPEQYTNSDADLNLRLSGAIEIMKKRVSANYRIAVPQLFDNRIQLLLPISLSDGPQTDLVLSVEKVGNKYRGSTCLSLEQAYNNARLIARPEVDWLNEKIKST